MVSNMSHKFLIGFLALFSLFIVEFSHSNAAEKIEYSVKSFSTQSDDGGWVEFLITLSEPLIDASRLYTELPRQAVQITPAVQGKTRWLDVDKIGFFPENALPPSVEYTIELSDSLSPAADVVLVGQRKFTHLTKPFQVERAELTFQYDESRKKAMAIGSVAFNYPVKVADVKNALSILTAGGVEIPYLLQTEDTIAKTLTVEVADVSSVLAARQIQVQVASGFKCAGAETGLSAASVASFVVKAAEALTINNADVHHNDEKPSIRLMFSSIIAVEALREHISIEPALPYRLVSNNSNVLEIQADFKHRSDYIVRIQRGVAATNGALLKEDYAVTLSVPDLRPRVRFADNDLFLPRTEPLDFNLATVNVEQVTFGIVQVYLSRLPRLIHTGVLDVSSRLNEEVITPLPLRDYLTDKHAGIFKVVVQSAGKWGYENAQLFVMTDLGILAKRVGGELWVWIHSLTSLAPIPQATVQLMDELHRAQFTGETDSAGFVKFSTDAEELEEFPLLTVTKGDDFSFIKLDGQSISAGDFAYEGEPYLVEGYEAFLYTDRGIYRPGETVNLVGIIRGKNNEIPSDLAVKSAFVGPPNQRTLRTFWEQTGTEGDCEVQIPLPTSAPTGIYAIRMSVAGKEIGRISFQVEEFMPDRMKVSLKTDNDSYALGDEIGIEVTAENLFGTPAVGQKVEASYVLEAAPYMPPDEWRSFHFADATRTFGRQRGKVGESTTGADGKTTYHFTLPDTLEPPSLLNGVIYATVQESGGRAVTASHQVAIHPYSHYVGIKRLTSGTVKPHEEVVFNYVVVDNGGNAAAGRTLQLTVFAISGTQITELTAQTLTSTTGVSSFSFMPSAYGRHRVEIVDIASGAKTAMQFYVSEWAGVPWSMNAPDRLDITLDKNAYQPGETAMLHINAPFPGKLLLTVEREKILSYQMFTLTESSTRLKIPVKQAFAPNVYLSAMLIRSVEALAKDAPARAFGTIPLKLDAEQHRLTVEIDAPEQIRPNREVDIKFRVRGGRAGQPYRVSIAAVDEGVLQLIDSRTPAPHAFFYRQRRLETDAYEFYTALNQGGDFPIHPIESLSELMILQLNQRHAQKGLRSVAFLRLGNSSPAPINSVMRVKPVSRWSGLMTTDANGQGNVRFHIPQFNGTLRVTAVAFSGADYGSSSAQIVVREPLVLTPTFPRFLSSGDKMRVPVTLFNGTGAAGEFTVTLQAHGPVRLDVPSQEPRSLYAPDKVQKPLTVAAENEGELFFDVVTHDAIGAATFELSATGNGESTRVAVELPIRSAIPPVVTATGQGVVRAGEPAEFNLPANLREDSSEFMVTVSPFPALKFANGLRYLIQYPHGCLEQTTSRVFPLLYFSELARLIEPTLAEDGKVAHYINAGISKLESLIMPYYHDFAYWPNGTSVNNWSSIYATHFLVEARKVGYEVTTRVYNQMLEGLRQQAKQGRNLNAQGTDADRYSLAQAVYACYVLALAGQPERGVMNFLRDSGLSRLPDYSQIQLAGAFALSGDVERAHATIPASIATAQIGERETSGNFDSPTRAQAIMLDVLTAFTANHPAIPTLIESLSDAATGINGWGTTQENAFAFLALGKLLRKQHHQGYAGRLIRDGQHVADFDETGAQYTLSDWDGARVRLTLEGNGLCYYYWVASGIKRDSDITEYGHGLRVNRRYFNQDGTEVKTVFQQGELVIAEITVEALTNTLANVAVVDMLPAGFEIENPRLQSRANVPELQTDNFRPDYLDIRDDRLVFFGHFRQQQARKFYYALRAVTPGTFTVPPIKAEAMYDPTKSAVAAGGTIRVVK